LKQLIVEVFKNLAPEEEKKGLSLQDFRTIILGKPKGQPWHSRIRKSLKESHQLTSDIESGLNTPPDYVSAKLTNILRELKAAGYLLLAKRHISGRKRYRPTPLLLEYKAPTLAEERRAETVKYLRIARPDDFIMSADSGIAFVKMPSTDKSMDDLLLKWGDRVAKVLWQESGDWEGDYCARFIERICTLDQRVNARLAASNPGGGTTSAVVLYHTEPFEDINFFVQLEEIRTQSASRYAHEVKQLLRDLREAPDSNVERAVSFYCYVRQKAQSLSRSSAMNKKLITEIEDFIRPYPLLTVNLAQLIRAKFPIYDQLVYGSLDLERLPSFRLDFFPRGAVGLKDHFVVKTSNLNSGQLTELYNCLKKTTDPYAGWERLARECTSAEVFGEMIREKGVLLLCPVDISDTE